MVKAADRTIVQGRPNSVDHSRFPKVHFWALGTTIEIGCSEEVADPEQWARDVMEVVEQCLHYQALFSRFEATSEISRINRNPGRWMEIHPDTADVLTIALEAYCRTQGLFHPALGKVLSDYGYDISFEKLATPVVRVRARGTLNGSEPYDLASFSTYHYVRLKDGYQLDLGGIAKGWIVEQGARLLFDKGYQNFVYNAGGDMICAGKHGNRPWSIGIANPQSPESDILTLDVHSRAVATSGTYRRVWTAGDESLHHIIHPGTGAPSNTDIVSCTAVAHRVVEAEVAAKVGLLLGRDEAVEWLKNAGLTGWVLITNEGEVMHSWNSSTNV